MKSRKTHLKRILAVATVAALVVAILLTGTYAYTASNQHRSNYLSTTPEKIFDLSLIDTFEDYDKTDWEEGEEVEKNIFVKSLFDDTDNETYTNAYLAVRLMEHMDLGVRGDWILLADGVTQALFAIDNSGEYITFPTVAEAEDEFAGAVAYQLVPFGVYYVCVNGTQTEADGDARWGIHNKPMRDPYKNYWYGDIEPLDFVRENGAQPVSYDPVLNEMHNLECNATPIGGWYSSDWDAYAANWYPGYMNEPDYVTDVSPRDYVSFVLGDTVIELADWQAMYDLDPDDPDLLGDFWILGNDGWAYYANPLAPGDETALLLDQLKLEQYVTEITYYMHVDMVASNLEQIDEHNDIYEDGMPLDLIELFKRNGAPPPDEPVIQADEFTVGIPKTNKNSDSYYVEPTNTFSDGGATYYFVTQDPSKADTSSVTYKGVAYPIVTTFVREPDVFPLLSADTTPTVAGADISTIPFATNRTFFFDEGTYVDTARNNIDRFNIANLSLVGLYKNGKDPATVIEKLPFSNTETSTGDRGNMGRYSFSNPNIYLENLVFDGLGRNMATNPSSGTNRGQYFWQLNGSTATGNVGFVANDIVIRNVGASSGVTSLNNINCAINVLYTDRSTAIRTEGQRNFNNIRFENVRTVTGYGVFAMNAVHDVYVRNLDMSNIGASVSTSAWPIKIEHSETGANYIAGGLNNMKDIVIEKLVMPSGSTGFANQPIWIQNYSYQVLVPRDYKYAVCSTSATATPAIRVYRTLQTPTTSTAVLDLAAKYWYVLNQTTSPATNAQLTNIGTVANYARAMTIVPDPRIKIVTSTGSVGNFTIPDYWTRYGPRAVALETHIVLLGASATPNSIYPALPHATNGVGVEFIPFSASSAITYSANSDVVSVYNIDFNAPAGMTYAAARGGSSAKLIHCLFAK